MARYITEIACRPRPCLAARQYSNMIKANSSHKSSVSAMDDISQHPFTSVNMQALILRGCTLAVVVALARPHMAQASLRDVWSSRRHFRRFDRSYMKGDENHPATWTPVANSASRADDQSRTDDEEPGGLSSQFAALGRSIEEVMQPVITPIKEQVQSLSHHFSPPRASSGLATSSWLSTCGIQPERRNMYTRLRSSSQSTLGSFAITAAASILAWLLLKQVWRAISGFGRKPQGGKYVYDRGLGGKEIFVSDDASVGTSASRRQGPSDLRLPADARLMLSRSSASPSSTRGLSSQSQHTLQPDWWQNPMAPLYVHPSQKEEGVKAAKRLLRELQNSKLEGRPYLMSTIVDLTDTCQTAGVSVEPSTSAGRDSIFRTAVSAATSEVMQSRAGSIAGMKPQQFLAAVSKCMGMPMKRAVQIVHAEVASRVRNMMIDACAARRAGNSAEHTQLMTKLSNLLESFPLPRNSAEGEVIASTISTKTTVEERKAIFLAVKAQSPSTAPLIAELLGFDPDLVLS